MGAGKSLFLLARSHNFEQRGVPFLCLKPTVDNRDGDNIIHSRALLSRECVGVDSNVNIFEAVKEITYNRLSQGQDPLKWILVDEAQFLKKEQVDQLAEIVDTLDISIICYGLRTDFKSELFEGSKRLFEIADGFNEIKSSCSCGGNNSINARIDFNGELITDGEQILIGSEDTYLTMCRKCYNEKLKNIKKQ
jgi:thymidine kinase